MTASTPEGKDKANIDAILKPYKASGRLWYTKTAGSMFGKNGVPDYVCCYQSEYKEVTFFTIEAKAGKGKPSDLQLGQMKDIQKAGGVCLVINENNLAELEDFMRVNP